MEQFKLGASNALSMQMWSDEGYGSNKEILKALKKRHARKRNYCAPKDRPNLLLTFDEHCKMLLEDWFGKPVYIQIGKRAYSLCLQRNNDEGDYMIGNCMYGFHKDNTKNIARTDEYRAKMSASKKGKKQKPRSDETKARMSAAQKGKIVTDETRAKQSAAQKGKVVTDETRAKLSAAKKGVPHSDEHKANLSAAHKGKKGTPHSDETKAKMVASRAAYFERKKQEGK